MNAKVKRLFEGFKPASYTVRLEPDSDSMQLKGSVTITGQKSGRPSQRITLHQHGLNVTAATLTRSDKKGQRTIPVTRINHHAGADEVRLHASEMLYPGQYVITAEFTGSVQPGMHGVYASTYELDGKKAKIVSTQFESHHAREAFPCIDEPEAKATFDLVVVSPKGETVISNMPMKSQSEDGGKQVTLFETTPKMSTYLLAFVYGDLQYKEATTNTGVAVRVWSTKAQPMESLDFGLDVAKRGIEFFDDYYGIPYPLAKCDHVAIPDFSAGAMENWGLITYRERCLLADPATASQSSRESVATVILHELSHQWFGNLVTMHWWNDLWLNESFANVMEYVATDALFPQWQIWNSFITQEGLSALRRDSISGVQPVSTEVRHPDEISTLFDPSIVYAKGGRLLNMLMRYVGDTDFRKGLKGYFAKHAYGNTAGSDLWAALGDASGKDVGNFMTPWINQPGFPEVVVDQQGKRLEISQHHFLLDKGKTDPKRRWPVPLLSSEPEVPRLLSEISLSQQLTSDSFVRLNEGAIGHFVVRYANAQHSAAIAQLVSDRRLGIAERLMLLSDSSLLARAGSQSFAATLELLGHYAQEDSEPVWDIISLIISDSKRFVDIDSTLETGIKAMVRGLIEEQYGRLGWDEKPGEPSQDTKLRGTIIGLGVYGEHPAIVKHALELFESYKTAAGTVPHELRSIIFSAAVRDDVPGAFDYLLDLDRTTSNVDLKHDILSSLTATRQPASVELLLGRLKDGSQVRLQDVDHWLIGILMNRYGREQAWQWLRANWPWLKAVFEDDKTYDYLPRYTASAMSTRKLLDEYTAFFSPLSDQPALTRNIAMGIEEITNRVAWLERDIQPVAEYFKKARP